MIAEGMTDEGLVLVRSIHDRYHAAKRNPFNEIECSDHYARAMASYGAFISACGFEYHGPKGYMRFAPKWGQDNFKAPFTSAEAWGTYSQQYTSSGMSCNLKIEYGKLSLKDFRIEAPKGKKFKSIEVTSDGQPISAQITQNGQDVTISFSESIDFSKKLEMEIKN
jgi:hypothetical protein